MADIDYGVVKSVDIGNDKDTDRVKYICDVEFSDSEDIRPVQIVNLSGVNSRPMVGHKVVVIDIGGGFEVGICSDDEIDADLEDGEVGIHSIDGSAKSFTVLLKPDGTIVFNSGEDWAVRYSDLEEQFNELNDKFNSLVDAYNGHIHATTATVGATTKVGVISSTTSQAEQSTADITTSKIDEIRLP